MRVSWQGLLEYPKDGRIHEWPGGCHLFLYLYLCISVPLYLWGIQSQVPGVRVRPLVTLVTLVNHNFMIQVGSLQMILACPWSEFGSTRLICICPIHRQNNWVQDSWDVISSYQITSLMSSSYCFIYITAWICVELALSKLRNQIFLGFNFSEPILNLSSQPHLRLGKQNKSTAALSE